MSRSPFYWSRPQVRLAVTARVLLIALLIGLMAFALGLFLGIVGIVVLNLFRAVPINLADSYRMVALPMALCGLVAGFVFVLRWEIRESRRQRRQIIH